MYYFHFTSDNYCLVYNLKEPSEYKYDFYLMPKDMFNPEIKMKKMATKLFNPEEIIILP